MSNESRACISESLAEQGLGAAVILEFDVSCPDGGFDTVTAIIAMDDESDATVELDKGVGFDGMMKAYMNLGGRVDSALSTWKCPPGVDLGRVP